MNEAKKGSPVLKILGIGCLVLIILGVLAGGCIWWVMKKGIEETQKQEVPKWTQTITDISKTNVDALPLVQKYTELKNLAQDGKIGFMAFGVILTVHGGCTNDRALTAEEIEDLTRVLDDILADPVGDLEISKYAKEMEKYK